jgi:polyisoprenoid-binding protein YceI
MAKKTWKVDPNHSEIQFKVKHLMITTVTGSFKSYQLTAETEGNDFTTAQVHFSADIDSITTGVADRDTHLKSDDFFDGSNHPQITFESTKIEKETDEDYMVYGDLTIRGYTKNIRLNAEFGGIVVDPYGQTKAGFTVTGKVSRKEFGLKWNAITEAGGVVVSDDVKLACEVQVIEQK